MNTEIAFHAVAWCIAYKEDQVVLILSSSPLYVTDAGWCTLCGSCPMLLTSIVVRMPSCALLLQNQCHLTIFLKHLGWFCIYALAQCLLHGGSLVSLLYKFPYNLIAYHIALWVIGVYEG